MIVNRLPNILFALLFFSFTCTASHLLADNASKVTVYALSGSAFYLAEGASKSESQQLKKNQELPLSGKITVDRNSRVGLRFSDGRLIRLRENSELLLTPATQNEEENVNLLSGALHIFNRVSKARYTVKTPEVSAAIRGTELALSTSGGNSTLTIFDGEALIDSQKETLRVTQGESATVSQNGKVSKVVLTHPVNQVQWALYFPVILSQANYQEAQQKGLRALTHTYEHALNGEYQDALVHLQKPSLSSQESLLKSSLLLLTGSPENAEQILNTLLSRARFSAAAAARLGLISLIKQDISQAKDYLHRSQSSKSAGALDENTFLLESLLLSQSGKVEEALDVIERALQVFPHEPLFLARKSELLLGTGDTKQALATALEAHALRPAHPMIATVLGFSYLARRNPEQAKSRFEYALSRNAEFPEAHFGMALSLLAEGQLHAGREELEKTVHLDTARSLYRSYLGKAFFEEEQEDSASKEFGLAIERDPNDPTPYLYRAFNRLSQNNVVGALNDIEESIARNDARGVYRSRSLLDQDLAVRSTSLSEVFRQLGFRDVARIEAMKSLSRDYSNYSAHRLLGETLEGDFFADAKFSQSIISELLSPLSFNSFQSFNGFSAEPSTNDYAALFDRPAHRTAINLQGTNRDDDYQGSILQSGTEGDFGYLTAYSYRNYSASRLEQQNARVALQYQPHADHRFILEGEIESFDDQITADTYERNDLAIALGSYHHLSNQTEAITRIEYFGREIETRSRDVIEEATQTLILGTDSLLFPEFQIALNQEADEEIDILRGNAQIIHKTAAYSLVSGVEYLYTDGVGEEKSLITEDSSLFFDGIPASRDSAAAYNTNTHSLYTYFNQNLSSSLSFTFGLNYRDIELPAFDTVAPFIGGRRSKSKLSPKLGFTYTPTDALTIRGAYFQTLGTSSVNDIGSIEPVLVGSFIQLLGDLPGVETETFGIGIDYKDPKHFYTGIEYAYRDIDRDGIDILTEFVTDATTLQDTFSLTPTLQTEQEREHLVRAYFYTIFSEHFTGIAEYRREYLEALDISEENDTNRVRLGARFFSSSRWFALTDVDWYRQDLNGVLGFNDGNEDFWILNAGVGYRLPHRKGQLRLQLVNVLDEEAPFASRSRFTDPPSGIGFLTDLAVNF